MKAFLALLAVVATAVASWAAVQRMDPGGALATAIAAGLALGVGLPLLVGVLLLWRSVPQQRAEIPPAERYDRAAAMQYPQPAAPYPPIYMLPALPTPAQRQASWAEAPGPRQYRIIGEDDGAE